jgi:glyoxylase-like metal-dependent hydrolase (beta-lactamase superfamily II)
MLIDVRHLGRERVIGCWEVDGVLIDPGPSSSMDNLIEALEEQPPRALLLTHIHLDHAGASGSLVRRWPELPVYVHERGARHLAEPSKLLASAERLYGDQMERLWGEVAPVPQANLMSLSGGEEVLGFRVAYTPGHAFHHVSYLHPPSGRAFVGDVAAVRIPPSDFVLPPTPPPDIDIELWEESIDRVLDWEPSSLGLTHFDAIESPVEHLELVRERLREQAELARELSAEAFEERIRESVAERTDTDAAEAMLQAVGRPRPLLEQAPARSRLRTGAAVRDSLYPCASAAARIASSRL